MTVAASPSVGGSVAVSAAWMVVLRLAFRSIGLVSTLILVRLLQPSDFGLVGLATVAYAVLDLLSELSFRLALIRMEAPTRAHYDTAWTLTVLRGVVIGLCLVASAPLVAELVGEPRVVQLSFVLAAVAVIQGLENVGMVDFQRELRFEPVFWYGFAGKLGMFCVAIPAAFLLRNYWALVLGITAMRLVQVPLSYAIHPYRPRFSLAAWRDLFNFSKWLMVSNVQWVIDSYSMTFLVGRIAGSAAIGFYQVAYEIAALPASEIAAPIRQPLYAGYSRLAADLPLLRRHFLDGFYLLVAVLTPASVGLCLMAEPITTLFLGPKWLAADPLVRMCAFYALLDAFGHFMHSLFTVLNRQRSFVILFTVALAIRIPSVIAGAYVAGVNGAVFAMMVTAGINMVMWTVRVAPMIETSLADIVKGTWRTLAASLVMAGAVWWLLAGWPAPAGVAPGLVRFAAICLYGAAVHITVFLALWKLAGSPLGAEAELLRLARMAPQQLRLILRRRLAASA